MTEYVMQYEPSPELLNRAMMAWAKPQRSRGEKIRRLVLGVLLYLILVFGVFLLLHYDLVTRSMLLGGLVGLFLGIVIWAATYHKSMKKITKASHGAMARHGVRRRDFRLKTYDLPHKSVKHAWTGCVFMKLWTLGMRLSCARVA